MLCSVLSLRQVFQASDVYASLGNRVRLFLQPLPTRGPNGSIKTVFLTPIFGRKMWSGGPGGEGGVGGGQVAAVLFSCLNTKSCVVTPLPDYQ